jgi:dTDP-4-dehydrorhamnose reductase
MDREQVGRRSLKADGRETLLGVDRDIRLERRVGRECLGGHEQRDGKKPGAYFEDDAPQFASIYGRGKLAGEEAVCPSGVEHLIFRTSWVFADRGKNFFRTVLRLAHEREELRFVADQFGAPTWARLVAEVMALALQLDLARRRTGGFDSCTFRMTAAGETS